MYSVNVGAVIGQISTGWKWSTVGRANVSHQFTINEKSEDAFEKVSF